MRTPRLFLGVIALALILPLHRWAGHSPTPRATAEPTKQRVLTTSGPQPAPRWCRPRPKRTGKRWSPSITPPALQLPVYPNSSPDHRACNSLTPLSLSSRRIYVSTGGFGLRHRYAQRKKWLHRHPQNSHQAWYRKRAKPSGRRRLLGWPSIPTRLMVSHSSATATALHPSVRSALTEERRGELD